MVAGAAAFTPSVLSMVPLPSWSMPRPPAGVGLNAAFSAAEASAAARMLNVSQPSVSKVLRHAESLLGFPLFDRTGGRLVPTEDAHTLFAEVSEIQERVYALREASRNLKRGAGSLLRVSALPSIALDALPVTVAQFMRKHKDTRFDLQTVHHADLLRKLGLGLRHRLAKRLQPEQAGVGEHDAPCARIQRIGFAPHQAPGLALCHQIAHGLLAHARLVGEFGQARALERQVARDVDVGRAHLRPCGEVGERQRHGRVARHQIEHALVKTAQGQTHQTAQVAGAPAVVRRGKRQSFVHRFSPSEEGDFRPGRRGTGFAGPPAPSPWGEAAQRRRGVVKW